MLNNRTLELLRNPKALMDSDLPLLDDELNRHPYLQSVRALKLLGINKFKQEAYPQILSETAAYTTDKKILYQLVKGRDLKGIKKEIKTDSPIENDFIQEKSLATPNINNNKPVYINGELNRILFEGEEDFFEKPIQNIDMESTLESGNIVLKESMENKPIENTRLEVEKLEIAGEPETIIDANKEEEKISDDSQLSFHATDDFLPQVNFTTNQSERAIPMPQKNSKPNRHELEMQQLIAEVEAKMKASKKSKNPDPMEEEPQSNEINFAENMPFQAVSESEISHKEVVENTSEASEQTWKPMDFGANVSKTNEDTKKISNTDSANNAESNVPKFINTWQSWLKLDRKTPQSVDETVAEQKNELHDDSKEKAIEKFIETEPKISKLKDEVSFVVKEKGDNISHLMTETLANLYVEQRLYAKAIKAFEVLIEKHPSKSDYFKERIAQTKELRQNK